MSRRLALAAAAAALLLVAAKRSRPRRRSVGAWPDEGEAAGYAYHTHHVNVQPRQQAPVIVLLHGRGVRPSFMSDLFLGGFKGAAHVVVPRGQNKGPMWWTARGTEQERMADEMAWVARDFRPFLDRVAKHYGRRPVVVGHSQGAMLALALALLEPSALESMVGAATWAPESMWQSTTTPIHLVHGLHDTNMRHENVERMAVALADAGAPLTLESVDHGHGLSGELRQKWLAAAEAAVS